MFQLRNFSALWDKKFSTKILILPPPLLPINFFATGNFLKHTAECFNYEIFRQCETKIFDGKSWYSTLPPLIHTLFRYRKFSETHRRRVPLRNVSGKNFLDTPPPLLSTLPETFWNTAPKGSPTKFFGNVKQKTFDGKSWYSPLPLLIHTLFRCRKLSETQHRRVHLQTRHFKKFSTENPPLPSYP